MTKERKNKDGGRKILRTVLILLMLMSATVAGVFMAKVVDSLKMYSESDEANSKLQESVVSQTGTEQDTEELLQLIAIDDEQDESENGSDTDEYDKEQKATLEPPIRVDFDTLREQNADVIAWIYIPNSEVNYPVVQGGDNSYYLTHLLDGTINASGVIFLQVENNADFSDQNSFLYGHSMVNRTMFGSLHFYKNAGYYDNHKIGWLLTPDTNYLVQWFAGYNTEVGSDAYLIHYHDDDHFHNMLRKYKSLSAFSSEHNVEKATNILTLSTCAGENPARFVLHGRLIDVGKK